MENTNWLKQTDEPLFPDLLWSRPENKRQSGKLLIIGGNAHGFSAPVAAFGAATKAGIGTARVIVPEVLKKTLGTSFAETEFAPSTPSGSFARRALDLLLENAKWADGVLLAGDFGRNSETSVLLDSFAQKYSGQLNFAGDAFDYFLNSGSTVLGRDNLVIMSNLGKLQKLAKHYRPETPLFHSMNLHELVSVLADWSNNTPAAFIIKHQDNFVVASGGKISTTSDKKESNWQVELPAYASVWWLQNSQKPFEALSTSVFEFVKK